MSRYKNVIATCLVSFFLLSCFNPQPSFAQRQSGDGVGENRRTKKKKARRKRFTRQDAELTRQAVSAGAEFITMIIWIGEMLRQTRQREYRYNSYGGEDGGFLEKVFTCDKDAIFPGLVGWCHEGVFAGPVHIGSGFAAIADSDAYVLAQTGLVAITARDFFGGVQAGAFANIVERDFRGLAQAGMVNAVDRDMYGLVQVGLANRAGSFHGIGQFGMINTSGETFFLQGGLYNDADEMYGIQLGGFLNRGGEINGISISSGVNYHFNSAGLMFGLVNVAKYVASGIRICAIANISDETNGLEIGLVNVTDDLTGVQLGLVNVTKYITGLQLGLVNVATQNVLPFMVIANAGF